MEHTNILLQRNAEFFYVKASATRFYFYSPTTLRPVSGSLPFDFRGFEAIQLSRGQNVHIAIIVL